MDKLKEIKEKMESNETPYEEYDSYPDILWLISEIERLRKENENWNVDYLREKTEREHLAKVLYKIENIEADTEQLRKIAGEAIKIELTEGKD